MSITNVVSLKALLSQGAQLSELQLNDAVKVLLAELETARRKVSDLESRVRSVELRR